MLTQQESGLTTQQYADAQTRETYHTFKVIAHKANLDIDDTIESPETSRFAWNGNDYIFSLKLGYVIGSTEWYDEIEVYRYTISTKTQSLVYTIALNLVLSDKYTTPAVSYSPVHNEVWVFTVREISSVGALYRVRLSSNGSSLVAEGSVSSGLTGLRFPNTPYFDILKYQAAMSQVDPEVLPYPTLTPSSTAAGSSINNAFDDSASTYFQFNATTGSIQFDDIQGRDVDGVAGIVRYAITVDVSTTNTPRSWTLDRWNGSTWVTCDTQTNITWTAGERKIFPTSSNENTPAYGRVRINVTAANGAAPRFRSIELLTRIETPSNSFNGRHSTVYGHLSAMDELCVVPTMDASGNMITGLYEFDLTSVPTGLFGSGEQNFFNPTSVDVCKTDVQGEVLIVQTVPYGGTIRAEAEGENVKKIFQFDSCVMVKRAVSSVGTGIVENGLFVGQEFGAIIVDTIPGNIESSRFYNARISKVNDFYVIAVGVKRAGGGGDGIYIYKSKDGILWSAPQYLMSNPDIPIKMFENGDEIITNRGVADSTVLFGGSPSALQEDITNYVDSLSISVDPMLQIAATLDNSTNHFVNHAFINKDNLVVLEIFNGFLTLGINGEPDPNEDPFFVPVGKVVLETMGRDQTTPEDMIQVSGRDFMVFMTDYIKPLEPKYFNSQQIGFDDYSNVTDTNYGGMSHTAIQGGPGKWETGVAVLKYTPPTANRDYSAVFSTLVQPIYQGQVEIAVNDTHDTSTEVGVVFNALDKDNFNALVWSDVDDRIRLYRFSKGIGQVLRTSASTYAPADIEIFGLVFSAWAGASFGYFGSQGIDEYSGDIDSSVPATYPLVDLNTPLHINPIPFFERYEFPIEYAPLMFGYVGVISK